MLDAEKNLRINDVANSLHVLGVDTDTVRKITELARESAGLSNVHVQPFSLNLSNTYLSDGYTNAQLEQLEVLSISKVHTGVIHKVQKNKRCLSIPGCWKYYAVAFPDLTGWEEFKSSLMFITGTIINTEGRRDVAWVFANKEKLHSRVFRNRVKLIGIKAFKEECRASGFFAVLQTSYGSQDYTFVSTESVITLATNDDNNIRSVVLGRGRK